MKTLKVEAVYPMTFETFDEVAKQLPGFIDDVLQSTPPALRARLYQPRAVRGATYPAHGQISRLILSGTRGSLHPGVKFGSDSLLMQLEGCLVF